MAYIRPNWGKQHDLINSTEIMSEYDALPV